MTQHLRIYWTENGIIIHVNRISRHHQHSTRRHRVVRDDKLHGFWIVVSDSIGNSLNDLNVAAFRIYDNDQFVCLDRTPLKSITNEILDTVIHGADQSKSVSRECVFNTAKS